MQYLSYPKSVALADTDYLKVTVLEYVPPGTGGGSFEIANGSDTTLGKSKTLGMIFLPIPVNIQDSNIVAWNVSEANSLALKAISDVNGVLDSADLDKMMNNFLGTVGETGAKIGESLSEFGAALDDNVRQQLKNLLISKGVNIFGANIDSKQLISRNTGQVLNPNLELLFDGVKLRNFNYSFDLTPRNQSESREIKGIIKTFKKRMAAKSTAGGSSASRGIFIAAPDVFKLEFMRGKRPHPFLYKMKVCALSDMQVSYNGTGNYMTYVDGTPIKMSMALNFREISPVYSEDYTDNLSDGVGF